MFPDPIVHLLIHVIVVLAIAGLFLWGVSQFPIDAVISRVIRVFVIVVVCVWLLSLLLGTAGFGATTTGR